MAHDSNCVCVHCCNYIRPCIYKPQTVPQCPFSHCKKCRSKPTQTVGKNMYCIQSSCPPPFPFECDPCPDQPINNCSNKKKKNAPIYVKMLEVQPVGRFIKLYNTSYCKTQHIGGCYLIQFYCGTPIAVFRFPSDATIPPQFRIRVWTACSDPGWQKNKNDHVFKDLCFWKVGENFTSVLYTPDGCPVTWLADLEKFEPGPHCVCAEVCVQ